MNDPQSASGVTGIVDNVQIEAESYGVRGIANGESTQIGVFGIADNVDELNVGVRGYALSSDEAINYGGEFRVNAGPNTPIAYGVIASAPSMGSTNTNFAAGYFNGDLYYTGALSSASDQAYKQNLNSLDSAVSKLDQLNPRSFSYDTANYSHLNLPSGTQYGLVAQDVEQVVPELVTEIRQPAEKDSAGNVIEPAFDHKTVAYEQLIPFLIKGFQDQGEELDSLKGRVSELEQENDSLLTLIQQNQVRDQQQSDSLAALHSQVDSLGTDSLLARIEALEDCMDELPQGLGCDDGPNALKDNGSSDIASVTVETKVHVNYDSSMTGV